LFFLSSAPCHCPAGIFIIGPLIQLTLMFSFLCSPVLVSRQRCPCCFLTLSPHRVSPTFFGAWSRSTRAFLGPLSSLERGAALENSCYTQACLVFFPVWVLLFFFGFRSQISFDGFAVNGFFWDPPCLETVPVDFLFVIFFHTRLQVLLTAS